MQDTCKSEIVHKWETSGLNLRWIATVVSTANKKIGRKERRVVDDLLHKISREIVNRAKEENAIIVLGDLKGIRKKKRKEIQQKS